MIRVSTERAAYWAATKNESHCYGIKPLLSGYLVGTRIELEKATCEVIHDPFNLRWSEGASVPQNCEGLTFSEWFRAATHFGAKIPRHVARAAWERGDDPTEWAASWVASYP